MSYYRILGLNKEPFSTSPDPSFFFASEEHKSALCRLQINIALKRGLNVVIGDIGTGKTTLSRKLSQALAQDDNVDFKMILNPYFKSEKQFLSRLASIFHVTTANKRPTALDYMESVERFLFQRGVEDGKTVVLLIDESQILPRFVLEMLRILLNYETNEYKILQLVLMGQMELLPRITDMPNFWDRIALKVMLKPLEIGEVRDMIDFRLRQAGYTGETPMFTPDAVELICEHAEGFPRRLNLLCHNIIEYMVMHDKVNADRKLVHLVIEKEMQGDVFKNLVRNSGQAEAVPDTGSRVRRLRVVGG